MAHDTFRTDSNAADRIAAELKLIERLVPVTRRTVHAGDVLYRAGQPFATIYIVNTGLCKIVQTAADGREQVTGVHFRGDWLGFDGLADARYTCEAVAMDTGDLWCVPYAALLEAAAGHPELLQLLHRAMSRQHGRDREALLALCTLGADARVADFLRAWAQALSDRGLRTDQITLRMTRAEIGNCLGLTLETVSRALSRLARGDLIRFDDGGARRDIRIPHVGALAEFVQKSAGAALAH